ncbi:unnamed protein product [Rhizoctonia solani]|uniref:Uncharacterized protein n=1 Tax=Rhizoctonia solani TaxID=456999 RepID=A0A8H3BC88_9AGAM|nr:unnamed protein product [Rhizoctonia solani]
MPDSHVGHAWYRPILLGIAIICSFISATWTASAFLPSPSTHKYADFLIRNRYWNLQWAYIGLHHYAIPAVILNYGTFLLLFVLKVILQWRLGISIPLVVEYICLGLAYCTQTVAVILGAIAAPEDKICSVDVQDFHWGQNFLLYAEIGRSLCSNWSAGFWTSVISLFALTPYFVSIPLIWGAIVRIVLPKRLREFNPPEASCEEPLLPEYSAHPAEAFEIQVLDESATARKDSIIFDASRRNLTPVTEHKQQGGLREPQKNEYKLVPGEDPDLERG